MPPKAGVTVKGYRELSRAFDLAGKEAKTELRAALKLVAVPVQQAAQSKAAVIQKPGNQTPAWSAMRIGVTRTATYVAPRRRGPREGTRKRPKFGTRLLERAMIPALEQNRPAIIRGMEHVLDSVGRKWERA